MANAQMHTLFQPALVALRSRRRSRSVPHVRSAAVCWSSSEPSCSARGAERSV